MNRLKYLLLGGVTLMTLLFGGALVPAMASADASTEAAKAQACQGSGGTYSGGACTSPGPQLDSIVKGIVNILSVLVGVTAVVMIMVGGFRYITSGGDSSSIGAAKKTIIYAVIGLIIVSLAQVIVRYVLHVAK